MSSDWILPNWPAPAHIRALSTTRAGGVSRAPYASMNLSDYVGDAPEAVRANRLHLRSALSLPAEPHWLQQVHGVRLLTVDAPGTQAHIPQQADASMTRRPGVVCVVQTADCLPILLCDIAGTRVAAVHAGWRGLAAGVLEAAVEGMRPCDELLAWLGPAIGPTAFEVGEQVRTPFMQHDSAAQDAFRTSRPGHYWADLYTLARLRLKRVNVQRVYGGEWCTVSEVARFFSYRRDGITGRMASLIWMEPSGEMT